jgi:membrane protein
MSALFAVYVGAFTDYGKTYGALGGVVALLMWFYLSGILVVLGAEINAEMERQTRRDTTEGPEVPMGQRGAYAADTIGPGAGTKGDSAADTCGGERDDSHTEAPGRSPPKDGPSADHPKLHLR